MKTKIKVMGIAVAASLMFFTNCRKEKLNEGTAINSSSTAEIDNTSSGSKTFSGFTVFALRNNPAVPGDCEINTAYDVLTPGSGFFQPVTIGATNLTYVSGITTELGNTTFIYGITDASSNFPGGIFKIDIATKVASYIAQTLDNFSAQLYFQDIERTVDGLHYYAIEVGTNKIYRSSPGVGSPPTTWTFAYSLPASSGATDVYCGLDICKNILVAYSNGDATSSIYPNSAGNTGFYTRLVISATGGLTSLGDACTNMLYAPTSGEDAALLISGDASINGSFVMIATPSFSNLHYHNPNTNLPFIMTNTTPSFMSSIATGAIGLMDYTYF
jgi:hypothetical protein